jgi:hypothetical protein
MWDDKGRVCCQSYLLSMYPNDDRSPDPYRQSLPEGLRTLNNASILNSVAFTDDQIGLIVPATATIPDNVDFTASTYGVHTTCQSITSQCINKTYTGPDTYLALNCASSTPFNFSMPTTATVASFGILNSSGHILESNTYNVNSKSVPLNISHLSS